MHAFEVRLGDFRSQGDPVRSVTTSEDLDNGVHSNDAMSSPVAGSKGSEQQTIRALQEKDGLQLPGYISPLRPDFDPELRQFLQLKKALTFPNQQFLEALLRAYICYVHPFLPLLDLEHFLASVSGEAPSRRISLVLFQAVMFAATSFVEREHLVSQGFQSRKEARRCFFERVRLLYEADVDLDPVTLIQVLVLMTYWYDKPQDVKGRCYYMRIALSLANDIGLNRHFVLDNLPKHQQKIRRRLWWCCVMRDKLISFSERRVSGVSVRDTDFPMLSLEDLQYPALVQALESYSLPNPAREAMALYRLCIQKTKLCVLIGKIMNSQYRISGHRRFATEPTIMLLPDSTGSGASEYMARNQELVELGNETCTNLTGWVSKTPQANCNVIALHCAVLEMLHQTAVAMIHRPQLLGKRLKPTAAIVLREFSQRSLTDGARRVTEVATYLESRDLLQFLPPIGVTALLTAATQHLKDMRAADNPMESEAQKCMTETMRCMQRLQEMYFSADHAVTFMDLVKSKELADHVLEHTDPDSRPSSPMDYASAQPPRQEATALSPGSRCGRQTRDSPVPPLANQVTGACGAEPELTATSHAVDYPLPALADPLEFESLLNINSLSDILLSENLDFADFDVVDWTDVLEDRPWGA